MSKKIKNQLLVIFGASGDLTARKLVPALYNLYQRDFLPENFAVLGVSRTSYSDEAFQEKDPIRHCAMRGMSGKVSKENL